MSATSETNRATGAIEVILNAKSGSQKAEEAQAALEKVLRESGRPFRVTTATEVT